MNYYENRRYGGNRPNWLRKINRGFHALFGNPMPMTAALIGITVGFYIITLFSWSLNLAMLFYAPLAFAEPWRFVTAALLHSGMIHLFFNMYSLWLLGGSVEPAFGKWNFLGLYVFSAITGNLFAYGYAVLTGGMNLILVGASGAIFGLFGALLVLTRHINGNTTGILIVLGINLLIGVTNPQISWQAHIGGFIGGALYTFIFMKILQMRRRSRGWK